MVDSINVSGLSTAGRIDAPDPKNGQVAIQKNLMMANASSYSIDFNSVNQQQTIGVIRTMFADNSSNPSEIVVEALGTGQRFTIPAYSEGYFPIISRLNAGIVLTTNGGATAPVGVTFFNYDIPAIVWYKYGAANKDVAQRVQGSIAQGQPATGSAADGLIIAGVDAAGNVQRARINAAGQIGVDFTNITIGGVTEADGANVALGAKADSAAPNNDYGAYSLIAFIKRSVSWLSTIESRLGTTNATLTTTNTKLDTVIANTKNSAASQVLSIAAATASTGLKAANVNRMQLLIFNESTAALYICLGNVASLTSYSVKVESGGYYEVPMYYTGLVNGIWESANGFARVTELS